MHECTASRFPLERRRVIVSTMKHAIVIGSGFGGLAAAVRLGVRGYRVTVLEKLDAPGGRAYVYHRDGYTFDGGPTIITAPYLFEDLWQLCGKRLADDVTLRSLDPFYLVRFDDGEPLGVTPVPNFIDSETGIVVPVPAGAKRAEWRARVCYLPWRAEFKPLVGSDGEFIGLEGHADQAIIEGSLDLSP